MKQESAESKAHANHDGHQERKKLPFLRTFLSIFQAAFGVQSAANKERDFKQGKPPVFILCGILFTTVFILTLVLAVKLALAG